jgi:hypothetical protein
MIYIEVTHSDLKVLKQAMNLYEMLTAESLYAMRKLGHDPQGQIATQAELDRIKNIRNGLNGYI